MLRVAKNKGSWAAAFALTLTGMAHAAHAGDEAVAPSPTPTVLIQGLEGPWHLAWGADDWLWVSERAGKRITRVHPATGEKKTVGTIPDAFPDTVHEGVLGFAFAPDFLQPESANHLFVYYIYRVDGIRYGRLARYTYDAAAGTMDAPFTLIENIPAGNDHNGGRLAFGPDGTLFLSKGEMGHNQFANACLPIEAQRLPTADEVARKDWTAYVGKFLRFNPDGGIPADNPELNGVRSHVYSYGHRNPQGLVFVGDRLFACEHGPSSDDEINLIEKGMNYGWPHVAGFRDGQGYRYANYSAAPNCADLPFDANVIPAGVPVQGEMDWPAPVNYRDPLKTFWTVRSGHNFSDANCEGPGAYICWPTVGPSSVIHYPADGRFVAWRNSLLMTTLKNGAVYRLPMSKDGTQLRGDAEKLFTTENRYRCAATDPKGEALYVATDNDGNAAGLDGCPITVMANPGAILVFK